MSRRPLAPDLQSHSAPSAPHGFAYGQQLFAQPGTFDFREGLATANPFAAPTAPPFTDPYSTGPSAFAANPMLALQQQQLLQQQLLQQQMFAANFPGAAGYSGQQAAAAYPPGAPTYSPGVQAELAHAQMLASLHQQQTASLHQQQTAPPRRAAAKPAAAKPAASARRTKRGDIHTEIRRCLDKRDKQGAYK
jgi:hypothetical protein